MLRNRSELITLPTIIMSNEEGEIRPGTQEIRPGSDEGFKGFLRRLFAKRGQTPLPAVETVTFTLVTDPQRIEVKPPVSEQEFEKYPPLFTTRNLDELSNAAAPGFFEKDSALGSGKRLIISGIPYRDTESAEAVERTVQIYRNEQGYLVANKVITKGEQAFIDQKGSISVEHTTEGSLIKERLGKNVTQFPYDYQKQDLSVGGTQLLSTTYKIPHEGGSYSSIEIKVITPDDRTDVVQIQFWGSSNGLLPEPILIREVDDK